VHTLAIPLIEAVPDFKIWVGERRAYPSPLRISEGEEVPAMKIVYNLKIHD